MGDATLKKLASGLTEKLRSSTTVDWRFRDSVRAKMRMSIRQLLRKYKYPPEGCEEAIALWTLFVLGVAGRAEAIIFLGNGRSAV